MTKTISESLMPPLGRYDAFERGPDPFSRQCMPKEFQHLFPDAPQIMGWWGLDWCGNVIGFIPDGATFRDKE